MSGGTTTTPEQTSTQTQSPTPFTRTLKLGSKGDDVKALQVFLNTHGYVIRASGAGSPGNETTTFGTLTKAALIRFQDAYAAEILTPVGLSRGTGFFGPATMRQVGAIVGNN